MLDNKHHGSDEETRGCTHVCVGTGAYVMVCVHIYIFGVEKKTSINVSWSIVSVRYFKVHRYMRMTFRSKRNMEMAVV